VTDLWPGDGRRVVLSRPLSHGLLLNKAADALLRDIDVNMNGAVTAEEMMSELELTKLQAKKVLKRVKEFTKISGEC